MTAYSINLPVRLKQEAEKVAEQQGISLEQFILLSIAEKIGSIGQLSDDPAFPNITYRTGSSGEVTPVLRGTGLRVQTVAIAHQKWKLSSEQIADEYELSKAQVDEILAFYQSRKSQVDAAIGAEEIIEKIYV
jgi:uncharacterized protein (DUF433 family)